MKGIMNNISCTSENSTSIVSSNMDLLSSTSSSIFSPCSSGPSSFFPSSRAIDRHNPIITDEKRRGSASTPTTPCANVHPITKSCPSPKPHHRNSSNTCKRKVLGRREKMKKTTRKHPTADDDHDDEDDEKRKRTSIAQSSDLIMKAACTIARPATDYISPPESSRCLLDESSSFIQVLSDFDPVLKLVPTKKAAECEVEVPSPNSDNAPSKTQNLGLPGSSSGSSHQVVVLRVSLHCRGCERKMKKHLSTMAGVTSFNIDFASKKVTVVGDVTPLQVLASISKVKNAQLWTPTPMSSSYNTNNPRNVEACK